VNRSLRHPASKGPADRNHGPIAEAILALGCPVMDLHEAGNGVEDLLVAVAVRLDRLALDRQGRLRLWLPTECKVPPVRYTLAQNVWRATTEGWPRITVVSAQAAVDQIGRVAQGDQFRCLHGFMHGPPQGRRRPPRG